MIKSNKLISSFNKVQKEFKYLQSINLYRSIICEEFSDYILNITLCSDPLNVGHKKLELAFSSVKELKLGNLDTILNIEISIIDISDYQLEGIQYKVKEEENELFSFYCKSFEFKEII